MKIIPRIISVIIITLWYSHSSAQVLDLTPSEELPEHKKLLQSNANIFEGRVMQQKSFYRYHPGGTVFTCSIIKITKIYKGSPQLKLGTIKLITEQGGHVENYRGITQPPPSDGFIGVTKGGDYIIFGTPTTFNPADTNLIYSMTTDNSLVFELYDEIKVFHNGAQWGNTHYSTRDSLYLFFKENGVTVKEQVAPADNTNH